MNESGGAVQEQSRDDLRRAEFTALRDAVAAQTKAEIAQLEATIRLCGLYDRVDSDDFGPLMEQVVRSGSDGTPGVSEFLCLELGAILGISPEAAASKLWRALDLVHRHPELLAQVRAGRVRLWQADRITMATSAACLDLDAARWVDRQITPHVERLPFGRVMSLVKGLCVPPRSCTTANPPAAVPTPRPWSCTSRLRLPSSLKAPWHASTASDRS
ncbi:hypothetical protein [Aestuariimicrobium ganziense]|uniref:hypothetical protein n=1 Tax=Aestuariimicrobium ganziense TaxID=2773677 RepID=UPI001944A2AD|nr:hypothetical protein [Aestuariimicrobium ganziense]